MLEFTIYGNIANFFPVKHLNISLGKVGEVEELPNICFF